MAGSIYNSFKNENPVERIMSDAKRLKESFKGNPKDEVQRLLNSGEMSQAQFNHFSQMAQQILSAVGKH